MAPRQALVLGPSGLPQQLQAGDALPTFTATAGGEAPASGGGMSNFLRADGAWTAVSAVFDFGLNAATRQNIGVF